jgi:hypothetical protein
MFRIDSEGATVDNRFTEGDPQLGVPATVVSSEWLNSVQEEIAKVVEENGITLAKANEGQMYDALLEMFLRGGRKAPVVQSLSNNTGPADVATFDIDSDLVKCKIAFYTIERKTDSQSLQESGILFITRNTADSVWRISQTSLMDDADTVFSLYVPDAIGAPTVSRLQYTTGDLSGASYAGSLDITQIFDIRI